MSTVNHGGATVPSEEFSINLDAHGFELHADAPESVEADLIRGTNGGFALEIHSDEKNWRVELQPNPRTGTLNPIHAFENGSLIASNEASTQPDIDNVAQWLRFVIRHVTSEVEA